jgi:hypothetical protein
MAEQNSKAQNGSDTLSVRLALAATRSKESVAEVSTDELLALRDGTLAVGERERVLAILDRSPASYDEWLALNRYLDDERRAGDERRRPRYLPWAAAAAAAVVAALIVTTTRSPTLGQQLEDRYAEALASGAVSVTASSLAFMGEPGAAAGFAGGELANSRRALGAGLWAGGALLSGATEASYPQALLPSDKAAAEPSARPWEGTAWAAHAALGRWLVLAAVACGQKPPPGPEFWQTQQTFAAQLPAALAEAGANAETAVLRRQMQVASEPLDRLAGGDNPARPCGDLVRAAGQMAALGDSRALVNAPGR